MNYFDNLAVYQIEECYFYSESSDLRENKSITIGFNWNCRIYEIVFHMVDGRYTFLVCVFLPTRLHSIQIHNNESPSNISPPNVYIN